MTGITILRPSKSCRICSNHGQDADQCPSRSGGGCVTIAGFTCGYCKETGHTLKHCEKLKVAQARRRDHDSWSLMTLADFKARRPRRSSKGQHVPQLRRPRAERVVPDLKTDLPPTQAQATSAASWGAFVAKRGIDASMTERHTEAVARTQRLSIRVTGSDFSPVPSLESSPTDFPESLEHTPGWYCWPADTENDAPDPAVARANAMAAAVVPVDWEEEL